MFIILCRFDDPYRKGRSSFKDAKVENLINPAFLSIFDDMFYRLPFPTALALESVLKKNPVILGSNAEFLASIRNELNEPRVRADVFNGWKKYLKDRQPAGAAAVVYASHQDRCSSPPPVPGQAVGGRVSGSTGEGSDGGDESGLNTPQHPTWHLGLIIPDDLSCLTSGWLDRPMTCRA